MGPEGTCPRDRTGGPASIRERGAYANWAEPTQAATHSTIGRQHPLCLYPHPAWPHLLKTRVGCPRQLNHLALWDSASPCRQRALKPRASGWWGSIFHQQIDCCLITFEIVKYVFPTASVPLHPQAGGLRAPAWASDDVGGRAGGKRHQTLLFLCFVSKSLKCERLPLEAWGQRGRESLERAWASPDSEGTHPEPGKGQRSGGSGADPYPAACQLDLRDGWS